MTATEKEKKCIDYSLKIRNRVVERKLADLNMEKPPIIFKPSDFKKHFWQDYDVTMKMLPFWKKTIMFLVATIFYIIIFPILFFYGIYQAISGDKNRNKVKDDLTKQYQIDYNVSEIKSFEELWNTKGLRDWDVEYYHLSFKDEDKIECLKNWCKILYNIEQNQFNEIIDTIRMGIAKSRQEFYRENPNAHISMVSPIQKLPTVIQNNFGNYIP